MAEVMAATQRVQHCVKTKAPDHPPGIPSTGTYVGVSNEIFPDQNWASKRHFNCHNKESLNEWDIMRDCDKGKACLWDGVHRHIMTSFDYNSVKHRPDVLSMQRNGVPEASRGDKSYQSPEYSSKFHSIGSTRPIPNFGGLCHGSRDTYIPLVEPTGRRKTFIEKERERQLQENTEVVNELDDWRPASPLVWKPSKNLTKTDIAAAHHQPQQ